MPLNTHFLALVLAAGKGTRMKSDLPKVLVPVLGRPMVEYVLDSLRAAGVDQTIVIIGYRADDVRATLAKQPNVSFVEQTEQLGTGHAVMMARDELAKTPDAAVLIVAGDSPMLLPESIKAVYDRYNRDKPACILGTALRDNPFGLGRIVRDCASNFQAIVEEKDASPEQKKITEVNMSCYLFRAGDLVEALGELQNNNAQREYYLTDVPGILRKKNKTVLALNVLKESEALSINTPEELQVVEQVMLATKKKDE